MANLLTQILSTFFGNKSDKDIQQILPFVQQTNEAFATVAPLNNDELRHQTVVFRQQIADYLADIDRQISETKQSVLPDMAPEEKSALYKKVDELQKERDRQLEEILLQILPNAFAVMKETARRFKNQEVIEVVATPLDRQLAEGADYLDISGDYALYKNTWLAAGGLIKWDMLHYDVQIIGGVALHKGNVAEMATGEGKTLVATLPAYLNGLAGQGVHIVTVNDYLARRDSEWMRPVFNFLQLTVDCIDKYPPNSAERRNAYLADITYGTNNEFGFDYLRDNMAHSPAELVQRKHHYAMVDEVDSVLIDDARTPLIISGPVPRGEEQEFEALKPRIERLVDAQRQLTRKLLNEAKTEIEQGKSGPKEGGLALFRAHRGLPKNKPLIKYLSEPGIKKLLFDTESYYLQEQGRRMPQADAELFFVIDEKHNQVELTEKGIELITGAGEDPNFFIMPDLGSHLADIENHQGWSAEQKLEAKDALLQDYAIKSERIHAIQQLLKAYALFEKDVEYVVLDGKVKIVDEQTGRIMEGRRYSDGLHQAIEAKENVKIEAATQTFATITLQNFFRMYHKLAGMTGTAETEAGEFWEIYKLDVITIPTNRPIVRQDREDKVYKTVREKFNAVVEEIVALRDAGRPVLVGTTSVEISEILSRMLKLRGIQHNVLNAKQHAREAEIVSLAGQNSAVTIATNMAGRGTDIKLSAEVKAAGGLAIIGTERHESRRVDRQLRGRSGRQGDPGSSQFFVSLEDNLMRLFGTDRIAGVMDKMGHREGDVIQHSMISKSIERAQKKVEENHFGMRKRLLDYDEVMNAQRAVVYAKRRHALFGERLSVDLANTFRDLCEDLVSIHQPIGDYEGFQFEIIRLFAMETAITADEFAKAKPEVLSEKLYKEVSKHYKHKLELIAKNAMPVISRIFEERGHEVERVLVPFSDGKRGVMLNVPLHDTYHSSCKLLVRELEKMVALTLIDEQWKEHLQQMDDLKQSVQNAVYEQKDPLLIYKREAFGLFRNMLADYNREVTAFLFRAFIPIPEAPPQQPQQPTPPPQVQQQQQAAQQEQQQQPPAPPRQQPPTRPANGGNLAGGLLPNVGRNDLCPCGSGKKYKHCHGK